jgi:hypothetical protein
MNKMDWVKGGLQSVVSALGTAPPELWADERVVGVAASAFLLSSLDSIGLGREAAAREALAAAVEEEFAAVAGQIEELAKAAQVDAAALAALRRGMLKELLGLSDRVGAADQVLALLQERVTALEDAVASYPEAASLRGLRDGLAREQKNALADQLNALPRPQVNTIVRKIGLDRDNIRGETKEEFVGEFVDECVRRGIVDQLVQELEGRKGPPR